MKLTNIFLLLFNQVLIESLAQGHGRSRCFIRLSSSKGVLSFTLSALLWHSRRLLAAPQCRMRPRSRRGPAPSWREEVSAKVVTIGEGNASDFYIISAADATVSHTAPSPCLCPCPCPYWFPFLLRLCLFLYFPLSLLLPPLHQSLLHLPIPLSMPVPPPSFTLHVPITCPYYLASLLPLPPPQPPPTALTTSLLLPSLPHPPFPPPSSPSTTPSPTRPPLPPTSSLHLPPLYPPPPSPLPPLCLIDE